ncbi:MAG: dTDP-4-dehydrorhamnose reductase [Petroclostridium sp.]|nr:dTDP-4-dehydrorhamnose reductase [Petroclostridium sp.]
MKVLILGSNGMLGHVVSLYLAKNGHDVTGVARSNNPFIKTIVLDVRNFDGVRKTILEGDYDFIINCAALLVDESERNKSDSILINSFLPHFISDLIKDTDTKLIQISTDSVFSGIGKSEYYDDDHKDCLRFYDLTKSLGEISDSRNITLRSSVIGLESKNSTKSLVNWFLNQNDIVQGYDKVIWSGITNLEYAKLINQIIGHNLSGVYNLSNNSGISKGDLLRLINENIRRDKITIISNVQTLSHRVLIHSKTLDSFKISSYENMMIDLKNWIIENKDYYEYFYGDSIRKMINIEGQNYE